MEEYLKDKKGFRKLVRGCKNFDELSTLFEKITNVKLSNGKALTLYIKNQYEIKIEDVWMSNQYGITCYFCNHGQISFKSIKEFSYRVELVEAYTWKSFSFSYDK